MKRTVTDEELEAKLGENLRSLFLAHSIDPTLAQVTHVYLEVVKRIEIKEKRMMDI